MREVSLFIASSIVEFERERTELFKYLWTLNGIFEPRGVRLKWNSPETMPHVMRPDGSQSAFDAEIRKCDFFFVIVGRDMGKYTLGEFETAWEQFQKTGKPKILTYFLPPPGQIPKQSVLDFCARLEGLGYYYKSFGAMSEVNLSMQIELFRGIDFGGAAPSDRETEAKRGQDAKKSPGGFWRSFWSFILDALNNIINREWMARNVQEAARNLIRKQRDKIAALEKQPLSPEVVAQIADTYEEIRRLVQTYKVEQDALIGYLDFLEQQNLYDMAIEIGGWLESFYKLENPGDRAWAFLKNKIGICYYGSNRHEQAGQYYQDALQIFQTLEDEDGMAVVYGNLGNLLSDTNRTGAAEQYYRKDLQISRRLASKNPADFEPGLATTCNNLGNLLSDTNRTGEAERYYREALEIRRRLASKNPADFEPELAGSCNNLAYLFIVANKMDVAVSPEQIKKAEPYLQKALEIWRRCADANPGAYKPYVAIALYNLGVLEYKRNRPGAARAYFEESLAVFEEFPHCTQQAQQCRDALAKL
ncbi:MAG: tetratricopeptide repeat protein [Oscillibacter sp.]|nr:tetratricopeptide repeat protein [Oscillibacter sp.]